LLQESDIVSEHPVSPIGSALPETAVYILNGAGMPQPVGVPGELYVGGSGVARGYLNNPQLTAERFSRGAAPFNRTYKTGDLGRRLPDGGILYLGRIDQQVKIRGYRIELGEIEHRLLTHADIREAVVVLKQDRTGDRSLCAYVVSVVSGQRLTGLREYLARRLPEYMVPAYFVPIPAIPLTPNGKLDRDALPEPGVAAGEARIAPRNQLEKKLAAIWQEVLNTGAVGIDDDFFELGGHSLRAAVLITAIHKELDVVIPLAEVFKTPTVRGLSRFIAHNVKTVGSGGKYVSIAPTAKKEYYPLSSAQKRLYFLQQLAPESTGYNMPLALPLGKDIDGAKLETALRKLISRHESLRTSFERVNEVPVQKVREMDEIAFSLDYFEARGTEGVREILGQFTKPFDLGRAPLIRSGLIRLPGSTFTWMIDIHHIVCDGTSQTVLAEDFLSFYNGDEPVPMRIQYRDFSHWQNRLFEGGGVRAQEAYWLGLYPDAGEIPRLRLPADFKRPATYTFAGDYYAFTLDRGDSRGFKALASRCGGTLYMNILTALNALFYKYTGQTDIIIGSGIAGRHHPDLQRIVGMFVNTLAMRNSPRGEKTYETFLKEVVGTSVRAFDNQDVQFEELVDRLELERDASRNPLFDVMMVVQNFRQVGEKGTKEEGLDIDPGLVEHLPVTGVMGHTPPAVQYRHTTSKFDMTFFIRERGEDVSITVEYYTGIFRRETVVRMVEHFKNLVKAAASTPGLRLRDIDILTAEEKRRLLHDFNDTKRDYPGEKTIAELFEEQVEKTPGHTAVVLDDGFLTYGALDRHANRVAHYLHSETGTGPGKPVGMLMDKSLSMAAALVGILKAGGAYVPISPSFPEERIRGIVDDTGMRILIGERRFIKTLNRVQWECRDLDTFLCVDSEDVYREEESETNELMSRKLWEYVGETAVDEVTGGGWNSSYTGAPIPREEMDEYGDNVLKKLEPLLHRNMRVLEIGAASGISMYRIAPKVGLYYGTDLSRVIIEKNRERAAREGHENIKLSAAAAHEIHGLGERDFDLVIINSVVQCFKGHNYLRKILADAVGMMGDSGWIFLGDLMDLDLKEDLIADLEHFKLTRNDKNYKTKTDWSEELFISRSYLEDLVKDFFYMERVEFSGKIYTRENELTRFRYDALIHIDKNVSPTGKPAAKHKRQHDRALLKTFSTRRLPVKRGAGDPAYIIYTSGSTGVPATACTSPVLSPLRIDTAQRGTPCKAIAQCRHFC